MGIGFSSIQKTIVVFSCFIVASLGLFASSNISCTEKAKKALQTSDSLFIKAEYNALQAFSLRSYKILQDDTVGQVLMALRGSTALIYANRPENALQVLNFIRQKHRQLLIANRPLRALLYEGYADIALDFTRKSLRDAAVAILTNALKICPQPSTQATSIYFKLAKANRLAGNVDTALKHFELAERQTLSDPTTQICNATEYGYCLLRMGKKEEALAKLYQAKSMLDAAETQNPEVNLNLFYYLANCHNSFDKQEERLNFLTQCIDIGNSYPEIHTSLLAYTYSDKAHIEELNGEFNAALEFRKLQVAHLQNKNATNPLALSMAYSFMAMCYRYLEKKDLTFQYWETALNIYPKEDLIYRKGYLVMLANYAEILIHSEKYSEGILRSNEVLAQAKMYDSTNAVLFAHTYLNRGGSYRELSNLDLAISDFELASEYFGKIQPPNWHLKSKAQLELANCLFLNGRKEEAIKVYEEAVASGRRHPSTDVTQTIGFISAYATFESNCLNNQKKALQSNQEAFSYILAKQTPFDALDCPNLDDYVLGWYAMDNTQNRLLFLRRSFAESRDPVYLEAALGCGLQALDLLRKLRQEQNAQADKINVNKNWRTLFQLCIQTAFDLYDITHSPKYLETAFEIAEQSKAMILMSAVIENRNLGIGHTNKELITQKKDLLAKMTEIRQEIQHAGPNAAKLREELIAANGQYEAIIAQIKATDPKYFEVVYDFQIASPSTIQKRLAQENRALIEYFYGDSTLFIFAMTKDTFFANRLQINQAFTDSITSFTRQLKARPDAGENATNFAKNGKKLYDALWILPANGPERVTVIPDGPLSFLSFEALPVSQEISNNIQFHDINYLIESQAIGYNYSATFFNFGNSKLQTQDATILAMAPSFEGHLKIKPLKEAEEGVKAISQTYPSSTTLTGETATKAYFLENAGNFDIIDLATHGIADSSNSLDSRLFFSADGTGDSILYLSELYNLKLDARLAILEACETGTGDFNQGEGVTSLARGFTYAGCKSILMSLWQVSEGNATSSIMQNFYKNMSAGLTLDMSITNAKRTHLQELRRKKGSELWKIHPFFWSELVLIGEDSAIRTEPPVKPQFPWKWVFGLAVILVLIGGAYFSQRKKRKKHV